MHLWQLKAQEVPGPYSWPWTYQHWFTSLAKIMEQFSLDSPNQILDLLVGEPHTLLINMHENNSFILRQCLYGSPCSNGYTAIETTCFWTFLKNSSSKFHQVTQAWTMVQVLMPRCKHLHPKFLCPHCLWVQKFKTNSLHKVGFESGLTTSWYLHQWICIHRMTKYTIRRSPPPPKVWRDGVKTNKHACTSRVLVKDILLLKSLLDSYITQV